MISNLANTMGENLIVLEVHYSSGLSNKSVTSLGFFGRGLKQDTSKLEVAILFISFEFLWSVVLTLEALVSNYAKETLCTSQVAHSKTLR